MPSEISNRASNAGTGGCIPWEDYERLRRAAMDLLLHPRSARAGLNLHDVLGTNVFTIEEAFDAASR